MGRDDGRGAGTAQDKKSWRTWQSSEHLLPREADFLWQHLPRWQDMIHHPWPVMERKASAPRASVCAHSTKRMWFKQLPSGRARSRLGPIPSREPWRSRQTPIVSWAWWSVPQLWLPAALQKAKAGYRWGMVHQGRKGLPWGREPTSCFHLTATIMCT